jgi:PAS domain S-box-containing protein
MPQLTPMIFSGTNASGSPAFAHAKFLRTKYVFAARMGNTAGICNAACRYETKMETSLSGMVSSPISKIASAPRKKIQEQEIELRQILDLAPQLIAVYGPNQERLYANRNALEYLGMSLDEWLQTPSGADVHPDDVEKLWAFEDRGSSSYDLEVRVRKGDGSFRWFLIRFSALRDEKDSSCVGMLRVRTSRIAREPRRNFSRKMLPFARRSTRPRCSRKLLAHRVL